MRRDRRALRALGILLLLLTVAVPAAARTSRLWSERGDAAAPLAQVPNLRALAQELIPVVVSIQVEQRIVASRGMGPLRGDPFEFFHRYFGGEMPREFHNRGLGTGFVVSRNGLILTNNHVVENADNIEVTFAKSDGSKKTLRAKVLGAAPEYDVALIQTQENANANIAYLGDSDNIQIGDWVMAVGNPFGLSHSVSVGIISAKERRDIAPSGRRGLYNFLQTDASINPGNSGGPLVNMRGEVIGINTAINASGSGIGFAIPINMVKAMLPDLRAKGKFTRSWIGIRIQALSSELAESYNLDKARGALVAEVIPDSPASEAGLREGDIVLDFDGKPVRGSSDLPLYASMAGVGARVKLKIWREGKSKTVSVALREFPDEELSLAGEPEEGQGGELGITIGDITPQLQRELSLEQARGVVIKSVERGSPAARSGLRPGDVILGLNGRAIKTARGFVEGVRKVDSGQYLRLKLSRRGGRLFLALKKP